MPTGYHAVSQLEHSSSARMAYYPIAKALRLYLHTGGQTMLCPSHKRYHIYHILHVTLNHMRESRQAAEDIHMIFQKK